MAKALISDVFSQLKVTLIAKANQIAFDFINFSILPSY